MTPQKRNGVYQLYVPRPSGGVVSRTTGTKDVRVYRGMKRMVADLKDARRWPLLSAVVAKRLTLGTLYDAHTANALDALEASLSATALTPHVADYLASSRGRGLAVRNVANVARQLADFLTFRPNATTADLTTATVTAWLASLTSSPGTRRQYLYAVTGFTRYLVDIGILADYPLSRVKAPKKNPPRMRYENAASDERIVQAARPDLRGLFAFVKGTGVDLGVAFDTPAREINTVIGRARLRGTKTAQRDVHEALIEAWALPYVRAALANVLPNARPWAHITGSAAYHHHEHCCIAVGVEDYTLKDSRHSVGVRMAKAGYTIHEIAEQLGNSPEICARVYTRFIPKLAHHATPDATRTAND